MKSMWWVVCGCSRWLVYVAWLVLFPCLAAGTEIPDTAMAQIDAWGFPVGETLVYRVYWGAIPVGKAMVSAQWKDGAEGKLLQFQLSVRSNRAIAAIYPVMIKQESIVRVSDFLPIRHLQNRREGRRRKNLEILFDHEAGEAIRLDQDKDRERVVALVPQTRDVMTLLYYLRRYPQELGNKTRYHIFSDRSVHEIRMTVGPEEMVVSSLLADPVTVVTVVPDVSIDDIFTQDGGVEVQISRDARQLMLLMRAKVKIGSIRVELAEVQGPGTDGWGRLDDDP